MKRFKKLLTILLTITLLILPSASAFASVGLKDGKNLNGYTVILHTNDTHSRAVADSWNGYMGFTAVSALKKSYEAAGASVILLDAGDTLHGLPFANLLGGKSIVEIMNLVGYDAMVPGNHDFNYGSEALLKLSKDMNFTLISSNIKNKSDSSNFLEECLLIKKNGITYGIFGLSTPETAYKTNPNNVASIEFTDPVDEAREEVAELKAAGADFIIALTHLGVDESSEFTSSLLADSVDGIDLIVDGHSHSTFEEGFMVKDTMIVSTGDYIRNIGVVLIDKEGKMKADLVNASEFAGSDDAVDELIATYTAEQEKLLSEVIGFTTVELDGIREHVRAGETNLGDLATDALRWATGAEVAILNGGGIRASIPVGSITKRDIITVFPFGNYAVTKYVDGEAILSALELGSSAYPETLGGFLQVSGIIYTIDASKEAGSRVSNVMINGKPIDPSAEYLLATNDFLIAGGDGYTMLADYPIVNEFDAVENILIDYLIEIGDVSIDNENRITILEAQNIPSADEDSTEDAEDITETEAGREEVETDATDGPDATGSTHNEDAAELPKTGEDRVFVAAVMCMLALSGAGLLVLHKKKGISGI